MNFDKLTAEKKDQVAKGFDATPELIPFIPYLLQDLWALGSSPHLIIKILKSLELPENSKVIDLACGKGAVSCKIADELSIEVLGIDLFEPFIDIAKQKARKFRVDKLCTFRVEDAVAAVNTYKNFDVVILASAESLLGTIENTIISLRNCVRQSGYIIFDGSYLLEDAKVDNPNYAVIKNYESTVQALKSQGDKIVHEVFIPAKETKKVNDEYTDLIRKRSGELTAKYPDKKEMLCNYVKRQEDECKIIENEIAGCIWCLKKT